LSVEEEVLERRGEKYFALTISGSHLSGTGSHLSGTGNHLSGTGSHLSSAGCDLSNAGCDQTDEKYNLSCAGGHLPGSLWKLIDYQTCQVSNAV